MPRDTPEAIYEDWIGSYPIKVLPIPAQPEPRDFFEVLQSRRSSRTLGRLGALELGELLYRTSKTLEVRRRSVEPDWEHRPLPSSGGCNAVGILVVPPLSADEEVGIYDSRVHGLRLVKTGPEVRKLAAGLLEEMEIHGEPTLLTFFADPGRIAGYYSNWESLVWRDSGVLVGGLSLTAGAMNLGFCPLGFSGDSIVKATFPGQDIFGVGGCAVGAIRSQKPE
jgi:hypothetical protein